MSSRKFEISFSPRAQEDIDDILAYTLDQWGEHQLIAYKDTIDDALDTISFNPEIGRDVTGMTDVRVYPAGKHMIFYRVGNGDIRVLRILHGRMDSASRLEE